jgi:hypothetical protein
MTSRLTRALTAGLLVVVGACSTAPSPAANPAVPTDLATVAGDDRSAETRDAFGVAQTVARVLDAAVGGRWPSTRPLPGPGEAGDEVEAMVTHLSGVAATIAELARPRVVVTPLDEQFALWVDVHGEDGHYCVGPDFGTPHVLSITVEPGRCDPDEEVLDWLRLIAEGDPELEWLHEDADTEVAMRTVDLIAFVVEELLARQTASGGAFDALVAEAAEEFGGISLRVWQHTRHIEASFGGGSACISFVGNRRGPVEPGPCARTDPPSSTFGYLQASRQAVPELEQLLGDCDAGDGEACARLFFAVPYDSAYARFAASCGGRREDPGTLWFDPCDNTGEWWRSTEVLTELAGRCRAGSDVACDELYWTAPFDSDFELLGATCGGRQDPVYGRCGAP